MYDDSEGFVPAMCEQSLAMFRSVYHFDWVILITVKPFEMLYLLAHNLICF